MAPAMENRTQRDFEAPATGPPAPLRDGGPETGRRLDSLSWELDRLRFERRMLEKALEIQLLGEKIRFRP